MKAWVLEDIGDFRLEDRKMPKPQKDQVLIKVMAAGICGSDIARVFENGAHNMPLIIGHEFSGQVISVGTGVDSYWINKRVGVFPLIPCMSCRSCQKKQYEMCEHYDYLGSRCDGGFAEYALVPAWNLKELPDDVSFEQAAMLEPFAVAVHAARKSHIAFYNSCMICGLGTIGLLLAGYLIAGGVGNLYVVGKSDYQKARAMEIGISPDNYYDIRDTSISLSEFVYQKTGGAGVDFYFDCVGKNETIAQGIELVACGGTISLVGNPYSDLTLKRDTYWKILRRQLTLLGNWNSSYNGQNGDDDWDEALHSIYEVMPEKLISHKFSIENLKEGFDIMHEKKEDYTKIMLTFNE